MPANPARTNKARFVRAVLLLLVAITCFDLMGVLIRLLLERYSAQELSAYRNVLGIIPSLSMLVYTGELRLKGSSLYIRQWPLAFLRGFSTALAQLCFFSSIGLFELATVSALAQTNGLFVVLLSVVLLKERVGVWRVSALGLGFVGALMILRPGSDAFSLYAILPVMAAACYAFSMVSVRKFDSSVSNPLLYLYSSAAAAVSAIVLTGLTSEFSVIQSWQDGGLIFAMAMLGGTAVLLMMLAYRTAPPSALAPFGYFGLLTAFTFGWLFFDEAPVETLFPGVLLIVAAGTLIMWRESRA